MANRGREASAYLAYIVQHYDALPAAVAFVMGNRIAYHNANLHPSHVRTWRNNGDLLALLPRLRWPADKHRGEKESHSWHVLQDADWNSDSHMGWRLSAKELAKVAARSEPPQKRRKGPYEP